MSFTLCEGKEGRVKAICDCLNRNVSIMYLLLTNMGIKDKLVIFVLPRH